MTKSLSQTFKPLLSIAAMFAFAGCYTQGSVLSNSVVSSLSVAANFAIEDGASSGTTETVGVFTDSSGNVFISGYTTKAIDGQTQHGSYDLFISKYSSAGLLQWTVQDGVTSGQVIPLAMTMDASGNIILSGRTTLGLDGQTLHGDIDLFITKYNSSGVRQWTVQDGGSGSGYTYGNAITTDTSGNIYIAGLATAAIDAQTQHGSNDLFITKYSTAGVRQWTVQDGVSSGQTEGDGIATDSSGNVYVSGDTTKGLDSQTQHGSCDLFLTKYSSAGVRAWTKQDGTASGMVYGGVVTADSSGNTYITGHTEVGLDGLTLQGTGDVYITAYNTSGTRLWTVEDGASSGYTVGRAIVLDGSGYLYATGNTSKGLDSQTQHGSNDIFVTKYSTGGARQWTAQDGASSGTVYGFGIALDSTNSHAFVTGTTTVALDGQTKHGSTDYFLTKYNSLGALSP